MNRFFNKKYIYSLSFVFFAAFLSSCAAEALWGGYVVAETLTVVNTDKTMADNVTSAITNKDCRTIRKNQNGDTYCLDKKKKTNKTKNVYCYRTLADPVCYTTQKPYGETKELNTLTK